MKSKRKYSIAAGLSLLLSTAYLLYSFSYFYNDILASYASLALGGTVARALILPHLFSALAGVCMNFLGFSLVKSRFVQAGSLLYIGAMVLYPPLSRYLILSLLLSLFAGRRKQPAYELAEEWD